jgi:hypothetical protein
LFQNRLFLGRKRLGEFVEINVGRGKGAAAFGIMMCFATLAMKDSPDYECLVFF